MGTTQSSPVKPVSQMQLVALALRADGASVVSTSTRNFPNRLGKGANVYLASAELAAVSAMMGKLPTVEEYMDIAKHIDLMADNIYRYMNFDQIETYQKEAEKIIPIIAA